MRQSRRSCSRRGAVRAAVVGDPHQRQEAVRRFVHVERPLAVDQGLGGEVHQDQARVHAVRQAGLAGRDERQAEVAVDPAEFRSRNLAVGKRHRGQERRQVEHLLLRRPAPVRAVLSVPPWRRGDLAVQPGGKLVPAELARNPVQSRARSSCDHVGSRSELEDDPALCVDAGRPLRVEESLVSLGEPAACLQGLDALQVRGLGGGLRLFRRRRGGMGLQGSLLGCLATTCSLPVLGPQYVVTCL